MRMPCEKISVRCPLDSNAGNLIREGVGTPSTNLRILVSISELVTLTRSTEQILDQCVALRRVKFIRYMECFVMFWDFLYFLGILKIF